MSKRKAKAQAADDGAAEEIVDEAELKSFSSWKFDLLETLNADPATIPTDVCIMEAYLHFTRARSRTAYLSALSLRVRTSISSSETIVARRKVLIRLGYLVPNGKTKTGIDVFRLVNARQNLVLDHVSAAQEKLKEMDAERKRRDREKRRAQGIVSPKIERTSRPDVSPKIELTGRACLTRNRRDVSPIIEDKHLEGTPVYPDISDRRPQSQSPQVNDYAKASRGY